VIGGCSSAEPCPPIGLAPLSIKIVDSATGVEICDAQVNITKPGFQIQLDSCPYAGGNGAGSYQVSAKKDGYAPKVQNVSVSRPDNECPPHMNMTITLVRSQAT
jgi:hypothetical protein